MSELEVMSLFKKLTKYSDESVNDSFTRVEQRILNTNPWILKYFGASVAPMYFQEEIPDIPREMKVVQNEQYKDLHLQVPRVSEGGRVREQDSTISGDDEGSSEGHGSNSDGGD